MVDLLSNQLQERIRQLRPLREQAEKTSSNQTIPSLSELTDRIITSASNDFNSFVNEFSAANEQSQPYQFVSDRMKYLRPACAAIAQSVIDTFNKASDDITDPDRKRLMAALYLVNQFTQKRAPQNS